MPDTPPENGPGHAAPAGTLLIFSGPSGVGKTTIARYVEQELDAVFSVSVTTRPKTPKDVEGKDYYFVDDARFDDMKQTGELLEWARVFDHCYGTPKTPIQRALDTGKTVILEIDTQGAAQIKKALPDAVAIFIEPPSPDALLQRLRGRKRDTEQAIQRRFAENQREISAAHAADTYDRFITNDDLQQAMSEALTFARGALTTHRQDAPHMSP